MSGSGLDGWLCQRLERVAQDVGEDIEVGAGVGDRSQVELPGVGEHRDAERVVAAGPTTGNRVSRRAPARYSGAGGPGALVTVRLSARSPGTKSPRQDGRSSAAAELIARLWHTYDPEGGDDEGLGPGSVP
jgi:hypothetical protein